MCHHCALTATAMVMLVGCASKPAKSVTRSFPADGITKLVVRAAEIQSATITIGASPSTIEISGLPTGNARGYHPSDPNWRETPAERWGFDFVAQRYGDVLVVSTKSEIEYIHHHYILDGLRIRVPARIEVIRQQRELSGSGEPDLRAP